MQLVEEHELENVVLFNDLIQDIEEMSFDFILSSHVIQHIPQEIMLGYICAIARLLKDNGTVLLTTTYNHQNENSYSISVFDDYGKQKSVAVSQREFESNMDKTGVQPVFLFSRIYLEKVFSDTGLFVKNFSRYRDASETDAKSDVVNNLDCNKNCEARDACYVLKKHF